MILEGILVPEDVFIPRGEITHPQLRLDVNISANEPENTMFEYLVRLLLKVAQR